MNIVTNIVFLAKNGFFSTHQDEQHYDSQQQFEQPEQLCELFELVFELFRELVVELAPDPNSINLVFAGLGRVLELPTVIGVS